MLRNYNRFKFTFTIVGNLNNRFIHLCLNLLPITTIAGVATMTSLIGVFLIT